MQKLIPQRVAVAGLLIILSLVVVFHVLVLTGFIPFEIVWGGRLKTQEQMVKFEAASIFINLVMLGIVSLKAGLLKAPVSPFFIRVSLWVMFALFLINTLGNLASLNTFEQMVFTPLTLLLSLFSLRLALSKNPVASQEV
ncbi:MAG: hypothetical protein ACO1O1_07790 [Adhaeribacter sp.]